MRSQIFNQLTIITVGTVLGLTAIEIRSASALLVGNPIRLSEVGTSNNSSSPSLAYNDIEQEYMTVWSFSDLNEEGEGVRSLAAQRLSSTGSLIGVNIDFSGENTETEPAIAYNSINNQYLVSFQFQSVGLFDPTAPFPFNSSVGQRLTTEGEFIGDDFLISNAGLEISLLHNPAVNEYFQSSRLFPGSGIFGQRIDSDGTRLGSSVRLDTSAISSAPNGQVALNSRNNQYLATWREQGTDDFTVEGHLVDADGTLVGEQIEIVPPPDFTFGATPFGSISTVFDPINAQFLTVYDLPEDRQIRSQFVAPDGTRIGDDILLTENFTKDFSIAFNESLETYLLSWTNEQGLFGQFISTSGSLINSPFSIAVGNRFFNTSVVANNDLGEFLVSWDVSTGSTQGIFAQRIDTTLVPEPSTILGLLTIGGIVLGASKKKQG